MKTTQQKKISNQIQNTKIEDLEFIYHLFDEAIAYQKAKDYPIWNGYDKNVLKTDIKNKLQFKIVEENNILCIFSICFSDSLIWRDKEKGNAIYLHRIVVNPKFKGQRLFEKILNWTIEFAQNQNLKYIRMDTWGNNQNIINYYQSFGFEFIENFTTPITKKLSIQYQNLFLALLEYEIKTNK